MIFGFLKARLLDYRLCRLSLSMNVNFLYDKYILFKVLTALPMLDRQIESLEEKNSGGREYL